VADTLDLHSLAEGYRALNDEASATAVEAEAAGGHDSTLAQWITGLSLRIDDVCGPVVARTITAEQREGGVTNIKPRKTPVLSVTSISEYDSSGVVQALDAEDIVAGTFTAYDYWLDPASGRIYRRSNLAPLCFASRVVLTYEAGRYADTASVDAKFKMAAAEMLVRLQAQYGAAWANGSNPFQQGDGLGFFRVVDPVINEMLAAEMLTPGIA
jgi:hypothetical protein